MAPEAKHRDKIVRATAKLIRRGGFAATGISEIAALSGAPKGSIYHYFPGGKDEIVEHALRYAGQLVRDTIDGLAQQGASPAGAARAYGRLLAGWMADSGFRDGCPIATTMLEVGPDQVAIAQAGRDAYRSWREAFAGMLVRSGVAASGAEHLSLLAVMLLEGALIVSRAERDPAPITTAFDEIGRMFDAACLEAREARPHSP
jgi:TetR/AcrR family transcriptional regulator, lmrAB and yxaGH operons repressor